MNNELYPATMYCQRCGDVMCTDISLERRFRNKIVAVCRGCADYLDLADQEAEDERERDLAWLRDGLPDWRI